MKIKNKFLILSTAMAIGLSPLSAVHAEDDDLKFGIMPATDSIPLLWAEEKGYFDQVGLEIELVAFTNGANRTTAMQTGELDGDLEGLVEYLTVIEENPEFGRIVTYSNDQFVKVAAPGAKEVTDRPYKIGGMLNSVIHYLTFKEFQGVANGYTEEFIPELPLRIQLLAQDQLDYAILPEPIASSAQAQGLEKTAIETDEDVNVFVFHQEVVDGAPDKLQAFLEAYDLAVADLQEASNLEEAKRLLVDTFDLPENLAELMSLPDFKASGLPSQDYIKFLQEWLGEEFDGQYDAAYQDLVFNDSAQ
ncbi:TPA: ABC transporter substrate-binding protein [Streptococcus suis]